MGYSYQVERPNLFTEDGQVMFTKVRDWVNAAMENCGAASVQTIVDNAGSGDSWTMLACIDRLVETKEIVYRCKCRQPPHPRCVVSRPCRGCEVHPNE
jgi:hypothetical protein